MKSVIVAALTLTLLVGGQGESHQVGTRQTHLRTAGATSANRGPCDARWFVNIKPTLGHDIVVRRVQNLIRCAVRVWSVSGGVEKALAVADCESHFWPWATNGSSKGVYQHIETYWIGRVRAYLRPGWFWQLRDDDLSTWPGIFQARANVLVSIRMAHVGGWGPWS